MITLFSIMNNLQQIILFVLPIMFGILPSIIWLLFYLRKDAHPESAKMILKIFSWGIIITVLTAIVEIGAVSIINTGLEFLANLFISSSVVFFLYNFHFILGIIAIAFIEEFFKFLVVKEKVLSSSAFDEPLDAMLYMVIAGLGFAAMENILVLISLDKFFDENTIYIIGLRFLGATFLHALSSATLGYFLALSLIEEKKKSFFLAAGLVLATLSHSAYNFFVEKTAFNFNFIYALIILLTGLALFVSLGFKHLKTKTSVCKL